MCTDRRGKSSRAVGACPLSDADDRMAVLPSRGGFDLETRLSFAYPDHVAFDQKVHMALVHFRATGSRDAKKR